MTGGAGDGIYGFPYSLTEHGGSYGVRIVALFPNPADPNENLFREWNGGFWIKGPQDRVPDDTTATATTTACRTIGNGAAT